MFRSNVEDEVWADDVPAFPLFCGTSRTCSLWGVEKKYHGYFVPTQLCVCVYPTWKKLCTRNLRAPPNANPPKKLAGVMIRGYEAHHCPLMIPYHKAFRLLFWGETWWHWGVPLVSHDFTLSNHWCLSAWALFLPVKHWMTFVSFLVWMDMDQQHVQKGKKATKRNWKVTIQPRSIHDSLSKAPSNIFVLAPV